MGQHRCTPNSPSLMLRVRASLSPPTEFLPQQGQWALKQLKPQSPGPAEQPSAEPSSRHYAKALVVNPEGGPLSKPTAPRTASNTMGWKCPAFCEGPAPCRFDISTSHVLKNSQKYACWLFSLYLKQQVNRQLLTCGFAAPLQF